MHDQRTHEAGVAEAHLGFGRVHICIHFLVVERDEQRHDRMPVARQIVRIGSAHRAQYEFVAHGAAVDEQILPQGIRLG